MTPGQMVKIYKIWPFGQFFSYIFDFYLILFWLLSLSSSNKQLKINKKVPPTPFRKFMAMAIGFLKGGPFLQISMKFSFFKVINLLFLHKFSLCQNLTFKIEKKMKLKKKCSRAFFKCLIPENKLLPAIFLFMERF